MIGKISTYDAAVMQGVSIQKIQKNLKKVIVPEFYLNFLTSHNAELVKQNKCLQRICYGQNTRPQNIYDSLGYAVLNDYCGDRKCQKNI